MKEKIEDSLKKRCIMPPELRIFISVLMKYHVLIKRDKVLTALFLAALFS